MKETLKFKLDAIPERFGGGYKAKMCARKRKWASGPARLGGQVSTSPLPTCLCNRRPKKLGRLQLPDVLQDERCHGRICVVSNLEER